MRRKDPLKELLDRVPADKKPAGEALVEELAFMKETLTRLKTEIRNNDIVEPFKQGKQDFTREAPALKAYNTTVQRYGVLYKQLTDLIGKPAEVEKSGAIYDFIKEGAL